MDPNALGLLALVALGVFGFLRDQRIKRDNPDAAQNVDRTWQDAPRGMRVSGYDDKTMNTYLNSKRFIVLGIIAPVGLVIMALSK